MAQQVVTELVIDGSGATAGANEFARAMDGAELAAKNGVDNISGMWAALGGASAVAAVAGLSSVLDQVARVNADLAKTNLIARQTGLSLSEFQSIRFAANIGGVGDASFNAGLERSASLLNDAQRNANSLTKLFDANGLSVRDANGQLITQNQLLNTSANLVARAGTEQDKIKIAEMLGYTKQWVPFLEQSADAIGDIASQAQGAGAVIDDETIKKADQFDQEWRRSSVEWSATLKAAALSVLPYIDDLILKAGKIFTKENVLALAAPGQQAVKDAGVPDSATITIDSDKLKQAFDDWDKYSDSWLTNVGNMFSGIIASINVATANIPPLSAEKNASDYAAFTAKQKADDAAQDAAQDKADAAARTVIPGKDQGSNSLDSAIAALERHTARTEADTQAVGLGAGALAEFRASAQLTAAALQSGLDPASQKVADRIQDLAQDAGDAAAALEKAKVAGQIQFGSGTAFLSQDDVRIAQQLKGIYGNDIPAALNSTEAAALKTNQAVSSLSSSISNDLTAGLTDVVSGTKSLKQGFSDMAASIIKDIEQMIIKLYVVGPLLRGIQSGASSLFGFGGASIGETSALAGASSGMMGGISFPIIGANAGGTDDWRGGLTSINERGGEIVDLPSGSRVIPHDVSMAMARGNQTPVTNVYIQGAPSQPTVTQSQNGSGGRDIKIDFRNAVRDVVNDDLSSGQGLARSLKSFSSAGSYRGA